MVHRRLNRTFEHRMCLLRNLVTNLIENESIVTTHAKAREAQTYVERLISRSRKLSERGIGSPKEFHIAEQQILPDIYKPKVTVPKLFGELADRYKTFTGGYTRVLKLENRVGDNAPQSILELIGGPRDMRMALTARIVARHEQQGVPVNDITKKNVKKICRDAESTRRFREEVELMKEEFYTPEKLAALPPLPPSRQKPLRAPIRLMPNPLANSPP